MFDQLLKLAGAIDPKQAKALLDDFRNLIQTVNQQAADIAEMKAQLARIETCMSMKTTPPAS